MFNLLLLLALYLPFQIALNPLPGIDLASIRVFILVMFFLWLAKGLKERKLFIPAKIPILLIISFLFLSLFSLAFSANLEWSWRKLFFLFSIFPLYFIAATALDEQKKILKISKFLVGSGILASLVGLAQFFLQFFLGREKVYQFWAENLVVPFLGKSFSQAVLQNPSWLVNVSGKTYLRATALFPDPHMFSFFLGLLIPLALALAVAEKKNRYFLLGFGIMILADILTFSRGGYLGLGAGLLMAPLIFWKEIKRVYKKVVIICFFLLLIFLSFSNPFSSRVFSILDFKEGSNQGRLATWKQALSVVAKNPLFGVGLGNYPLEIKPTADYREPIYAHNTYLDIALDSGIPNALIWLSLLLFSLLDFFRRAKESPLFWGAGLGLVIFSVHSLVETAIFSPTVLALLLLILSFGNCPPLKNERKLEKTH